MARSTKAETRRGGDRETVRAANRARQRLCRRRKRYGLRKVVLSLPWDIVTGAWKAREGLPVSTSDADLPYEQIIADLEDLIAFTWAPRWIRRA
jgi:hypothetical protein